MSSVSKVGVGEDIDISDNIQEGYLKSAILKGQTLVNIAPKYEGKKHNSSQRMVMVIQADYSSDCYTTTANGSNCNIALRLYSNGNGIQTNH